MKELSLGCGIVVKNFFVAAAAGIWLPNGVGALKHELAWPCETVNCKKMFYKF